MRVFLDTNVLVSAFASRGMCADLVRHVLIEHDLLVGEVVLTELKRILVERIKVPRGTVADIERLLRDHQIVPRPKRHLALGLRDRDDEWVIASASAANADALVTGDNDILHVRDRVPVRVFTPREFWEHIRSLKSG